MKLIKNYVLQNTLKKTCLEFLLWTHQVKNKLGCDVILKKEKEMGAVSTVSLGFVHCFSVATLCDAILYIVRNQFFFKNYYDYYFKYLKKIFLALEK